MAFYLNFHTTYNYCIKMIMLMIFLLKNLLLYCVLIIKTIKFYMKRKNYKIIILFLKYIASIKKMKTTIAKYINRNFPLKISSIFTVNSQLTISDDSTT